MKKNILFFVLMALVIIWMIAVFQFSAQTSGQSKALSDKVIIFLSRIFDNRLSITVSHSQASKIVRKLAHFTLYFIGGIISTLFVCNAIRKSSILRIISYALCFGIMYAISDEIHQNFVPGRGPAIIDVYIDIAGFLLGTILITFITFSIRMFTRRRT